MIHSENPNEGTPTQTPARDGGVSPDPEAEAYWDLLTAYERRLMWLTASGKEVCEIAASCAETPRKTGATLPRAAAGSWTSGRDAHRASAGHYALGRRVRADP